MLSAILNLKKLCNHPRLLLDALRAKDAQGLENAGVGLASVHHLFPEAFHMKRQVFSNLVEFSGKLGC